MQKHGIRKRSALKARKALLRRTESTGVTGMKPGACSLWARSYIFCPQRSGERKRMKATPGDLRNTLHSPGVARLTDLCHVRALGT